MTNSAFSTPAWAALARASASISSVMSRPIARPVGPTRRALMSTSAPAPDPRSSTVSPVVQVRDGGGYPAAQRRGDGGLGCTTGVLAGVEVGAEHRVARCVAAAGIGAVGRLAAAAAARGGVAVGHAQGGVGVAGADVLAQLVVGQLSHVVNSSSASGMT